MQRRALLKGLLVGVSAAAVAVAATAAAKSTHFVQETSEQSLETCRSQFDDLRERMERSEASTRKVLKVVVTLTALSLGMDVSALL